MTNQHLLFDRELWAFRKARIAGKIKDVDYLLAHASADLIERLSLIKRHFPLALNLGCYHGLLSSKLQSLEQIETVLSLDNCFEMVKQSPKPALVGDEEFLPIKEKTLDLVCSALNLQWINDVPGTLIQIRKCLKPDGLFIATTLGPNSLTELRLSFLAAEEEIFNGASMRVSPFADVRDYGQLLQRAGFALPVTDVETLTVNYPSPMTLFEELKAMGASNCLFDRHKKFMRKDLLERASEIYVENFSTETGKVRASFELISLLGWAPSPDQPKPLRPGSAQISLTEIFGTEVKK